MLVAPFGGTGALLNVKEEAFDSWHSNFSGGIHIHIRHEVHNRVRNTKMG